MTRTLKAPVALIALAAALTFSLGVHAAGDPDKGKTLSRGCTCHRGDLDGMAKDSFLEKMHGFKDGKLENRIMQRIAQKYSDQDMQDLAAFYSKK